MKTARPFKNGESQAARLTKVNPWDVMLQSLKKFPPDFMEDRYQPLEHGRRESF
ncbi:MAG TPA: hypothetical protein VMH77_08030 [Steroidobacteraceae bacterium]|nr:hypothetical protein [Steroidobacteraceae bacterium]